MELNRSNAIIDESSEKSKSFDKLTCELVNLGALLRADLFDGKTVVVECSKPNEEKCAELVQRVLSKFNYNLKVKLVKKGKIAMIRNR